VQFVESSVIGVRSAVLTLARRTSPMRFVLFPMIHVGERSFYDEVARRLRRCSLVVAEGPPMGTAPVQERAARFRVDGLVDQIVGLDPELERLGVPVIWEVEPRPPASQRERLTRTAYDTAGAVGLRLLGRYRDPRGLPSLDEADDHDDRWVDGRLNRWLRETIVDRRDAHLIRTLTSIHEERGERPDLVAVVFGAGHMPAVVEHLRSEFRYYVKEAEWLTVAAARG
jgi:hypothetical protein